MTKLDKSPWTSIDYNLIDFSEKVVNILTVYTSHRMEEQRHLQLMTFMTEFRTSIEDNIKKTNNKMDENMKEINVEMKNIKDRMDTTETDTNDILRRMDNRLNLLEI